MDDAAKKGKNAASGNGGRRWTVCDLGRFAIRTTRKRLLAMPPVRPFVVQNLGKYERQVWVGAEFGEGDGKKAAAQRQRAYIEFILKLANATPLHGYTWLHGVKAGRMVHVGPVDAPANGADRGTRTRTLTEKQIFLPLRLSPPPVGVRGLDCPFAMASRPKAPPVQSLHLPSIEGLARDWPGARAR
jgi:hypothetical protein